MGLKIKNNIYMNIIYSYFKITLKNIFKIIKSLSQVLDLNLIMKYWLI